MGRGRPRVAFRGLSVEDRRLCVLSAGKTLWESGGDTERWCVTQRDCMSVYYCEIVRDARGCVWLCDLVRCCVTECHCVKSCYTYRLCVTICEMREVTCR